MKKPFFANPEAAEYAFYMAIEGSDLEAMMTVWEPSETIICIHPLGPRLQGLQQIRASWRQILNSGVRLRFRIEGIQGLMPFWGRFLLTWYHQAGMNRYLASHRGVRHGV